MLTGERAPTTSILRIIGTIALLVFTAPWIVMGGLLTWVGILVLGIRPDIPELWFCLPIDLFLLAVFGGVLHWALWRIPRRTIVRFAYEHPLFVFEAPAYGSVTRAAAELQSIVKSTSRRGLRGWWLKWADVGWVFLNRQTTNADRLIHEFGPFVSYEG